MRRKLLFDIPKGPEVPYWKIKGRILGEVWAPLYHAYSYYMPASAPRVNRDIEWHDRKLKKLTRPMAGPSTASKWFPGPGVPKRK